MRILFHSLLLLAFLNAPALYAQEVQGAEAIINAAIAAGGGNMPNVSKDDLRRFSYRDRDKSELRLAIETFAEKSVAAPPADALKGWLALLNIVLRQTPEDNHFGFFDESDLSVFLTALPPPETWAEIVRDIQARPIGDGNKALRMRGLRILAAVLNGDEKAQWAEFDAAKDLILKANANSRSMYALIQAHGTLCELSSDPQVQNSHFEWTLALIESNPTQQQRLEVPDLAATHGAEKAQPLILRALKAADTHLYFTRKQSETFKLAQKLALNAAPELSQPCWQLCENLSGLELYEALEKRFPIQKGQEHDWSSNSREVATAYYMLALIAAGQVEKAKKLALENEDLDVYGVRGELSEIARDKGLLIKFLDFFHTLVSEHPKSSYWEYYWLLAENSGDREKACKLILAQCSSQSIQNSATDSLLELYFDSGREAEGLALFRDRITKTPVGSNRLELALTFAAIGRSLNNKAYCDEALGHALTSARTGMPPGKHSLGKLTDALIQNGQAAEAENILLAILKKKLAKEAQSRVTSYDGPHGVLLCLAELYSRLGRHADVLLLLDRANWWNADDLMAIAGDYAFKKGGVGTLAATALLKTGRKDEADKLLRFLLDRDAAQDALYQLFVDIHGEKALPFFEELQRNHPFEERPLIWKAHLLLAAGKLDEAEKTAKQAITIDPSDGEEGPGDRMRVYAVLGEIVKAKGDTKNAEFFRNVTSAIRLAEEADVLRRAGLTQMALRAYEKALQLFADAYCIQSRMALQLAEAGRFDEAAVRYRKAYELMPYSFGRMESHCFGCEGIFRGKLAQDLAEQVFGELLKKDVTKPQLHYLLGQLRESQKRDAEALAAFQKAVELDPDYINAWEHVLRYAKTTAEKITAARNIVRLNPRSTDAFGYPGLPARELWALGIAHLKSLPTTPQSVMPLSASKKHRDNMRAHLNAAQFSETSITEWLNESFRQGPKFTTPGSILARDKSFKAASELFGNRMDE